MSPTISPRSSSLAAKKGLLETAENLWKSEGISESEDPGAWAHRIENNLRGPPLSRQKNEKKSKNALDSNISLGSIY